MNRCQLEAESTTFDLRCEKCPRVQTEDVLRRINAALEEQARCIGQALHDEAGQTLSAAHISLAEAYELAQVDVRVHLTAIKKSLDTIDEQLRLLSHELRPRILDDLGLVPALRFLAEGMRSRGVAISFTARTSRPLPAVVETALYRLVQESFTNIRRHASATRVLLELEERQDLLWCRISDNGVGFDTMRPAPSGLGLVGIRDRFDGLGATLTIDSQPGGGTRLLAVIPLEQRHACQDSAR
jgi:signal transduction histidine kinase